MRRLVIPLSLLLTLFLIDGCKKKEQPAEVTTIGNATDRSPVDGTSGTALPPAPPGAGASGATGPAVAPVDVTGTVDVHAAKTVTTSTVVAPTTTTAAVVTPTDTSTTVAVKKKP